MTRITGGGFPELNTSDLRPGGTTNSHTPTSPFCADVVSADVVIVARPSGTSCICPWDAAITLSITSRTMEPSLFR